MRHRPAPLALLTAVAAVLAVACAPMEPLPDPAPDTRAAPRRPLPAVRVEQVAGGEAIHPSPAGLEAELAALERGERVTLTAHDADLRALLVALAEAAGVDLVVGPAVQGRVTVHLEDVAARDALDALIEESGHMIARPMRALWGPVVFYVVPADVDAMDAAGIRARFGVSAELARFMVRARAPR